MVTTYHPGDNPTAYSRERREHCPLCDPHRSHQRNLALYPGGGVWCFRCEAKPADLRAALGIERATAYTPPPRPPRPISIVAALPPVSHTAGREYLSGITTPTGARIDYQRIDGQTGRHWRNPDKRRNPGVKGDGWQVRRFDPERPGDAPAIALAEGEKDAALLAAAGLIAFCAPRGAQSLPSADFTELVELAQETALPVLLAGDNDAPGRKAMAEVRNLLYRQGIKPTFTAAHAPEKGSIADLGRDGLADVIRLELMPLNVRMLKPGRMEKKHAEYRCLRPKHWQGIGADGQTVKNLRPCGQTATCPECEAWENFLHLERAIRGRPAMLVTVSGFGRADSTIAQTVGAAKEYRTRLETRIRRNGDVQPLNQKSITGEQRHFLTALRIGADYRASLTLILSAALGDKELAKERKRAESAGLTFSVVNHPLRGDVEAIVPRSLTVNMEWQEDDEESLALALALALALGIPALGILALVGHLWQKAVKLARRLLGVIAKRTDKTNTWSSSGWPQWIDLPTTYQFSDGRDLAEGEAFDADAIERREWRKDNRQTWDKRATLRGNVHQREDHAERNAQLWVSACVDLNLETLVAIANATTTGECESILAETDYTGPVALLRDLAGYLNGYKPWRRAFRPVLAVLGVSEWAS